MDKLKRAFYQNSIENFLVTSQAEILGILAQNNHFELSQEQRTAWLTEIKALQNALSQFSGHIFFEYAIPRMGKRVDIVLLIKQGIFVVEFKVGSHNFDRHALDQVTDYALDLKNFHAGSLTPPIFPILLATAGRVLSQPEVIHSVDGVYSPLIATEESLPGLLNICTSDHNTSDISWQNNWAEAGYHPTPTIIEAAQALYAGHSVTEISRNDAGAINLSQTSKAATDVITHARAQNKKVICFITGVPGAGKTLAGLNIANTWQAPEDSQHAVFLSGNGPLVSVLREALSRDEKQRADGLGHKISKKECERRTAAFIQNIHHFRDEMLRSENAPIERVVIFDEAQRAWDKEQTSTFMQRKRGVSEFSISEPEFLLSIMDRHQDWAVIICLIGGGQEINTGEAGISEWYSAISRRFSDWHVWISPNLQDSEYLSGDAGTLLDTIENKTWKSELHLATSIRSFRSEKVSAFVKSTLDLEQVSAKILLEDIKNNYPIVMTRNLDIAKNWLKKCARGSERYGVIASSGAQRLKPLGLDVKSDIDEVNWFLNSKNDVRSSYYFEGVATEFQIQGLELDWTCLVWDADFRFVHDKWEYWQFRGTNWQRVQQEANQRYLKNAYRVLLTRARQGMIIVIPEGNRDDFTRRPDFYDGTYHLLHSIGLEVIS